MWNMKPGYISAKQQGKVWESVMWEMIQGGYGDCAICAICAIWWGGYNFFLLLLGASLPFHPPSRHLSRLSGLTQRQSWQMTRKTASLFCLPSLSSMYPGRWSRVSGAVPPHSMDFRGLPISSYNILSTLLSPLFIKGNNTDKIKDCRLL